jgi:hypothetical protein
MSSGGSQPEPQVPQLDALRNNFIVEPTVKNLRSVRKYMISIGANEEIIAAFEDTLEMASKAKNTSPQPGAVIKAGGSVSYNTGTNGVSSVMEAPSPDKPDPESSGPWWKNAALMGFLGVIVTGAFATGGYYLQFGGGASASAAPKLVLERAVAGTGSPPNGVLDGRVDGDIPGVIFLTHKTLSGSVDIPVDQTRRFRAKFDTGAPGRVILMVDGKIIEDLAIPYP